MVRCGECHIRCCFLAVNGERHFLPCRHFDGDQIAKWTDLMTTQNKNSSATRLRKMWHTDQPSIQGPWTPWTHKSPELNVTQFPNEQIARPMDVEQTATEKLIEIYKQRKLEEVSSK